MDEESRWVICRTCLKNDDDDMVKIFQDEDDTLVLKIEAAAGISLSSAPNLPDRICHKCLTLLKAATKFRTTCQRSQVQLNEQFGLVLESDHEEDGKEIIICDREDTNEENVTLTESMEGEDAESLVYSVEFEDSQDADIIEDEDESAFVIAPKEQDEKVNDFVEQDMDNLELVVNLENNKDTSFKIVPQFSGGLKKSTRPLPPVRQPQRRRRGDPPNEFSDLSYVCAYCGNTYSDKTKLKVHLKQHSTEKPHQCEICLKSFTQAPQLARHMNSHTGNRPFQCKYCTASFADPSTRIKHERIHTNERPYKCTVCEKAFSYSNVLKVHMMTHTGEKPYVCRYCSKQFSQAHHKRNHEKLHENSHLKLPKPEEQIFKY